MGIRGHRRGLPTRAGRLWCEYGLGLAVAVTPRWALEGVLADAAGPARLFAGTASRSRSRATRRAPRSSSPTTDLASSPNKPRTSSTVSSAWTGAADRDSDWPSRASLPTPRAATSTSPPPASCSGCPHRDTAQMSPSNARDGQLGAVATPPRHPDGRHTTGVAGLHVVVPVTDHPGGPRVHRRARTVGQLNVPAASRRPPRTTSRNAAPKLG